MRPSVPYREYWAAVGAAIGFLALTAIFACELFSYRAAVLDWALRDLHARTELAARTLAHPLETQDFRRIHAFGDDCARKDVHLTIYTAGAKGVVFDSRTVAQREEPSLYAYEPCGEYTLRLGVTRACVLAPFRRALVGFLLAALVGVSAMLFVFFALYRQHVRIRELVRQEKFRRAFVADFSHELKTPLTGITGAADMLSDENSPAVRARLLEMLKRESMRLNALAQDVLDLARLEREGPALEIAPVDVSDLVREAALRHGCSCDKAPPCVVNCDGGRIAQVLDNLLSNARRHAGTEDIRIEMTRSASEVRIAVEDRGVGIPPAARAHVFERFYRVDSARAANTGGAGLGLAISRQIARLHGGDLVLQAVRPHGCRFVLLLPAKNLNQSQEVKR